MIDYLYDGSFEGLLTCIYYHYYEEKASGIYPKEHYQASLLAGFKTIETDAKKAARVYEAIERKISNFDLRRIYRVFLSNDGEKENKILNYVRLGFKEGSCISSLHSNPIVFQAQQCEQKVSFEVHRLLGLVRFSVLKYPDELFDFKREILYCILEPDHDVLELIADHFSDRLKNDPFIIYDKTRKKAVFAQGGSWYLSDFQESDLPELSDDEKDFRNLWKEYFETMAIKERINPRCQKRCMPVRYWKNLTEFH
ncbi:TIGR03915 family putative DNA repair protein [Sinanaerobacter chloroacetimidivorans]|uniref:TIGR03915 family putative DNA repair protein n=1 Tax=Sinanaerobacter chloroacetimidivorans TaxID=2818044 RepID=UPI001D0423E8|nr:TIGR03915 family putative DNA repair protein [Sinanaerobacter chloroacetimidivorans]